MKQIKKIEIDTRIWIFPKKQKFAQALCTVQQIDIFLDELQQQIAAVSVAVEKLLRYVPASCGLAVCLLLKRCGISL